MITINLTVTEETVEIEMPPSGDTIKVQSEVFGQEVMLYRYDNWDSSNLRVRSIDVDMGIYYRSMEVPIINEHDDITITLIQDI